MSHFPFIKQLDSQDCGLACLKMISKYYGARIAGSNAILEESNVQKKGISIEDLSKTAEELGFNILTVRLDLDSAENNVVFPSIFFWNQNHFVVVYKIKNDKVYVADPAFGKICYSRKEFLKGWTQNKQDGIIIVIEPTEKILNNDARDKEEKRSFTYVSQYLKKHKTQLLLISLTLFISSCIELVIPFFTKTIIDKGVAFNNTEIIYLILVAQITIFISKISLEFYRSWLFIHISSRISLSIISDFLRKLMQLPIKFFNTRNIGDLIQRIQDHKRIEEFLSKDLIQTVFSIFSVVIFSVILLYFNTTIFLIVLIGTAVELVWVFSFLKKIRFLDKKSFTLNAKDQNKIYELITAMQEIKLNNIEDYKREEWQKIQTSIYFNNITKLKINQKYESYRFISFFQNIMVVFVAAMAIMDHTMTIGSMLSIMYIIGGMNTPISQLITFVLQYELVKVSFERLNEIHNKPDEENTDKISHINDLQDINLSNISFSYNNNSNYILKDVSLHIPKGKTTAIVGMSGSGKTTLLKLILKFYKPQQGIIALNNTALEDIDNKFWRDKCGVILQDSFIFSDTIAYNISLEENANDERLANAVTLANMDDFISALPLKLNTIIGSEGTGISQGQKQRILIARAIYKNPDYLFFDEATNSLDAKNERIIVENINDFFREKTMIVVAHRLSTVKNADQIVVIDNGEIIEKGKHEELIIKRGKYFELIQNQLELGE